MRFAALLLLLPLGACAQDPFVRPQTWNPEMNGGLSSNDANLRTMVVDPRDLAAGTGEDNSVGNEAAPPVRRLLSGQRKPLLDTSTSTVESSANGSQQPAAPTPTGPNVNQ